MDIYRLIHICIVSNSFNITAQRSGFVYSSLFDIHPNSSHTCSHFPNSSHTCSHFFPHISIFPLQLPFDVELQRRKGIVFGICFLVVYSSTSCDIFVIIWWSFHEYLVTLGSVTLIFLLYINSTFNFVV